MNKYVEKIERLILKACRYVVNRGKTPKCYHVSLEKNDVNNYIYDRLISNRPFMLGRVGFTECYSAVYPYAMEQSLFKRYGFFIKGYCPVYREDVRYENDLMVAICNLSGFFPNDYSLLKKYQERLWKDIGEVDLLGCHTVEDVFTPIIKGAETCPLGDLEPYDYERPWSRALAGKKVLVVHPFADTIEKQYKKREYLWVNSEVLPKFELHTIKAVQSIAGEEVPFKDWFEALHYMESQMNAIDYDVAIIGCGAYGFSLAAHAKRMGKKAIHLGGATQILFGIKGKRWDELPAVNKFYNDYWVYPSSDETPKHKEKVEDGCYW